jgi:hypothetical protein
MIDGDGNEGKSFVSLDLAARLSTGRPMPDGTEGPGIVNSLIIQDEDGGDDTLYHRLVALGADLDRISLLTASPEDDQPLCIPSRLTLLDEAIRLSQARFVIIDPILAFLDASILACNEQAIRRAFRPLRHMAEKYNCVIAMIRHLAKVMRGRALYRGLGSVALTNVCRSAWLIGRDPHDPDRRVFAPQKSNLAQRQPSLAYRITGSGTAAKVEWEGATLLSADHLVGAAASPELDRAREFLGDFLKGGPRLRNDILAAAEARHIGERTLRRAAKRLELRSRSLWRDHHRHTYWLLKGQCIPLSPDGIPNEFDQLLAKLQREAVGMPSEPEA